MTECCKQCLHGAYVNEWNSQDPPSWQPFCVDRNCCCHRLARIEALLRRRKGHTKPQAGGKGQ